MKSAGKLTDVRSVNKSSAMEFRLVLGLICGWGGLRPVPAVIAVRLLLRLDTDLTLRAVSRWIPHGLDSCQQQLLHPTLHDMFHAPLNIPSTNAVPSGSLCGVLVPDPTSGHGQIP